MQKREWSYGYLDESGKGAEFLLVPVVLRHHPGSPPGQNDDDNDGYIRDHFQNAPSFFEYVFFSQTFQKINHRRQERCYLIPAHYPLLPALYLFSSLCLFSKDSFAFSPGPAHTPHPMEVGLLHLKALPKSRNHALNSSNVWNSGLE